MVVFVACCSLIGFYSLPLVDKHLSPRPHVTSTGVLLVNAACILSMASAVPLQASLLGLASPSFPPLYSSSLGDYYCRPAGDFCDPPSLPTTTTSVESASSTTPLPTPISPSSPAPSNSQPSCPLDSEKTATLRQSTPVVVTLSGSRRTTSTKAAAGGISGGVMALYNLSFIATSWWLFRRNWPNLKRAKEQRLACSAVGSLIVGLGGRKKP